MTNMETKRFLLGEGALTWNAIERRSDRYGSVYCCDKNSEEATISPNAKMNRDVCLEIDKLENQKGKLIAVVTGTRQSTHIGDFANGFFPETPALAEEIVLGEGTFIHDKNPYIDNCEMVGVLPDDGRKHQWMNGPALYRAHEQDVKLYFVLN